MAELVRQGFICPFCMQDMGDFPRLQTHVEMVHPEAEPDLADTVVQNFKGLLDKAKRGIKKIDAKMDMSQVNIGVSSSVADLATYASNVQEKVQEKSRQIVVRPLPTRPETGIQRSLTSFYVGERDNCVNESAVRTNMLIIRLDRLINECPVDQSKRKEFEREVVPWTPDSDSLFCPGCGNRFGLTRRRHHCRLCGKVMCANCSKFFSFFSARKLTNPAFTIELDDVTESTSIKGIENDLLKQQGQKLLEMTHKTTERMKHLFEGAVSRIGTDGSEVSLGSLLQQDVNEHLRICQSCLVLLDRRGTMMEQSVAPAIVEQYATLDRLIAEVYNMAPVYTRMAGSILGGETMYTLKAAEEMRQKVICKQREIDQLSQSIARNVDSPSMPPKEAQLRKNVRYVAVLTLQGLVSSLVALPSKEQYEQLVEKHKQQVATEIEQARQRPVEERHLKSVLSAPAVTQSHAPTRSIPQTERKTQVEEGWTPQQMISHNPFMDEQEQEHPLYQQRDIIKNYLSQAANAGRLDEVEMLERNLRDLEEEMRRMGLSF